MRERVLGARGGCCQTMSFRELRSECRHPRLCALILNVFAHIVIMRSSKIFTHMQEERGMWPSIERSNQIHRYSWTPFNVIASTCAHVAVAVGHPHSNCCLCGVAKMLQAVLK